jgi:hypothetical protein
MRRAFLTGAFLMLVSAGSAFAAGGPSIELQILQDGQPVAGVQVAVFLSCDKVEGATGKDGRVVLESSCAGGFYWVELDGRRVDTLYQVEPVALTLDLGTVRYITWGGGL